MIKFPNRIYDLQTIIMTWRYECVRTCMALRGQSCIEEKYQRFCSRSGMSSNVQCDLGLLSRAGDAACENTSTEESWKSRRIRSLKVVSKQMKNDDGMERHFHRTYAMPV